MAVAETELETSLFMEEPLEGLHFPCRFLSPSDEEAFRGE